MKKLCRNCGAKIPKKSDICKKCGEPYEYIDLNLDPETEKALQVEKPSNMLSVCILLLSILIFIYSLILIYLNVTNKKENTKNKLPSESSVSDTADSESDAESDTADVHYNAVDFIGQPFSEVKKVLGEQYTIKLSDTTLVSYVNFPVTLSTTDETLTDESIISKVIVTDNAQISPVVSADMTYDELKIVLGLTKPAPEPNPADAFFYASKLFDNDICQIQADFKFDDEATDKAPLEVILTSAELTAVKRIGVITGLDEGSSLNVRSEALYDAEALAQVYEGEEVEILDEVESGEVSWYQILTKDNITGYSVSEFIIEKTEENSEETEETEETSSDENTDEAADEETAEE